METRWQGTLLRRARWSSDGGDREERRKLRGSVPVPLFKVPTLNVETVYEVHPDGQRFLVANLLRPAGQTPITIVLNWTALLKQ